MGISEQFQPSIPNPTIMGASLMDAKQVKFDFLLNWDYAVLVACLNHYNAICKYACNEKATMHLQTAKPLLYTATTATFPNGQNQILYLMLHGPHGLPGPKNKRTTPPASNLQPTTCSA